MQLKQSANTHLTVSESPAGCRTLIYDGRVQNQMEY
jgi:hypothetical protein